MGRNSPNLKWLELEYGGKNDGVKGDANSENKTVGRNLRGIKDKTEKNIFVF